VADYDVSSIIIPHKVVQFYTVNKYGQVW